MPSPTPRRTRWITNPTYNDYYRAAAVALEARDVKSCVEQLAAALSLEPAGERALELVEQLTEAYPGVVSQIPRSGEAFFGTVALRALLVSRYDAAEARPCIGPIPFPLPPSRPIDIRSGLRFGLHPVLRAGKGKTDLADRAGIVLREHPMHRRAASTSRRISHPTN